MCGIVGYIGSKQAADLLLAGLDKLSYRGYDSAGIAVRQPNGNIVLRKKKGKLNCLKTLVEKHPVNGREGIGHTRWATHGEPSDVNAHPQTDNQGKMVVVHNGIIENHAELRSFLHTQGAEFVSQTDTEVIAHMLNWLYEGDMLQTLIRIQSKLKGSYALAVMCENEPGKIFCVRCESPLAIGICHNECFLASDVPALLSHTREILFMQDGEIGVLDWEGANIYTSNGRLIERQPVRVEWEQRNIEKENFDHFMLKEIYEQPFALQKTFEPRSDLSDDSWLPVEKMFARQIGRVTFIACGTAYHAGVFGKYIIERFARLPAATEVASEFRYRQPVIVENELVIAISQSGETADTLAGIREAKKGGAQIIGICNTPGSSMTREVGEKQMLYTYAGPEIAVASTKAFVTQAEMILLIAAALGRIRGTLSEQKIQSIYKLLHQLPNLLQTVLEQKHALRLLANRMAGRTQFFFIGRGLDYAIAMEAALKLKEVSYLFSEAYPAGELKHGPLALLETERLVIACLTQTDLADKMISNIQEVKARGADVWIVCTRRLAEKVQCHADDLIVIPDTDECLAPLLAMIPFQLFAYYMALNRGCDVDQPRNLAKSVTVE